MGDVHARSRFARFSIPEEKWGPLVVYGPINDRLSHGIDNKLNKHHTKIITFSSAKTGLLVQRH